MLLSDPQVRSFSLGSETLSKRIYNLVTLEDGMYFLPPPPKKLQTQGLTGHFDLTGVTVFAPKSQVEASCSLDVTKEISTMTDPEDELDSPH